MRIVAALVVTGMLLACESSTDVNTEFGASLTSGQVVPSVVGTASGTFSATLAPSGKLTYTISYGGLTGASTAAHIHGPATAADTAAIVVNLDATTAGRTILLGVTAGTGSGTIDFAASPAVMYGAISQDSLLKLFERGRLYVDVHTGLAPRGAIRGQITRK